MSIPPVDEHLKDWLQVAAWAAAAIGALVAAAKFWFELRAGREQRERELRWKQAEKGKELNDELLTDPSAWPALQMLDYEGKKFPLPSKCEIAITYSDLRRALDPSSPADTELDVYIRECFDGLFYFMTLLQHYIRSTLILAEDVAYPLDYYIPLLAKLRPEVKDYLRHFNLSEAEAFLQRYPAWASAAPPVRAARA
jgi:hypothetical protein